MAHDIECHDCRGSGSLGVGPYPKRCPGCDGTGRVTPECNAEALRVVQTLPAWQPATRRGVPVPVLVQVPVPFDNAGVVKFENDRKVPRSTKDAPGLN